MSQDAATNQVHIECAIAAPRDRVWQALTDPALMTNWYAPPGWSVDATSAEVELKAGGLYRISLHKDDDASVSTLVTARFTEVVIGSRLVSSETVFGASGLSPVEMTLAIDLADTADGTMVTIDQGPFPYGVATLSEDGWNHALARLGSLLAGS